MKESDIRNLAHDYSAWCEYFDTSASYSEDEFNALSIRDRVEEVVHVYERECLEDVRECIEALRTEAGEAGDIEQIAMCNEALEGCPYALVDCVVVIIEGEG